MSTINLVAHGLTAGQRVAFSDVVPTGTGIDADTIYYVLAAGLTLDAFQISEVDGGAPLTLALDVTSANMQVVPETTDSDLYGTGYTPVSEPTDVHAPPTTPAAPDPPNLTSSVVAGLVRLFIEVPSYDDSAVRVRLTEVQITHAFDAGTPIWEMATDLSLPSGTSSMSIPALSATLYNARSRAQDVYGNYSEWSTVSVLTTDVGFDSSAPADGSVHTTTIEDGAITTDKLHARAVTADILAATIVLSSLIQTAQTGTRVEIDQFGIRLYDSGEDLLVNIPTNGDPVYVRGKVTASELISQTAASLYGTNTLPSSSVTTLENGISAPTQTPTLTASVDYLPLTSTPADISTAGGIAYDSGAGTFWIAADPTAAGHYVAHEFNASTGAYVRSISATGSTTTNTTTLGSTSHVSDSAEATSLAAQSQIATPLVMPRAGTITKVSIYAAGAGTSVAAKMGIWNTSGDVLKKSAEFTMASRTFSLGNSIQYERSLTSGLAVASGATIWAGLMRTETGDTYQWDIDEGSGKTTKFGAGYDGDMTSITTRTTQKPNIYITYTYTVDTRLETAANVGVATDGTYIYTLDTNGIVWKYNRSTLAYVSKSAVLTDITGTKSKAGLFFYNAGTPLLVVTTTTGTGAGVYPKFIQVTPSTLAVHSTYPVATGPTFSGTTDTFRGGVQLADPLNGNAFTFWISTTSAVYAYQYNVAPTDTFTNVSNRNFGSAATSGDGLCHDGTQFRGWDASSPTKVWKFSNWDWTTASPVYWVGYSWYDGNVSGGYHETACGPRSSITMSRRTRLTVTNAAIPTGGVDDPDSVRVYMAPGASNWTAGSGWLQATGTGTSRTLTTYTGSGTNDGSVAAFSGGAPALLKPSGGQWELKGDGTVKMPTPIVRQYTSGSTTWTKPAGVTHIVVECVGGGGGGGSTGATGTGEQANAAGGGGGGYVRKLLTAADLASLTTATVAVGAGGSGGTSGGNGGTGGTSSFTQLSGTFTGSPIQATGGAGGEGMAGTTGSVSVDGGAGGVGSNGDVNARGGSATGSRIASGAITYYSTSGGSIWGGGKEPAKTGAGSTGYTYGGGGSGATALQNSAARSGGTGGAGIVIITEFYAG